MGTLLVLAVGCLLSFGAGWHCRLIAYARQGALHGQAVRDGTIRSQASTEDGRDARDDAERRDEMEA